MTRRHYIAIAAALSLERDLTPTFAEAQVVDAVALRLSGIMAEDNPNFDHAHFLRACNYQGRH